MKITNHYQLPKAVYDAVSIGTEMPQDNVIRVTSLISPPLIRQLLIEHWEKLSEDASDRLWALFGQCGHTVLGKDNCRRVEIVVDGMTITGEWDFYNQDLGRIEDYKFTSVWSYIFGDKPEWECQTNIYCELARQNGLSIKNPPQIHAFLRDWQKSKRSQDNYPKIPFQTAEMPLWHPDQCRKYIKDRLALHKRKAQECTPEEKWMRPTTWAVKKRGRKTAIRVLSTNQEAQDYLAAKSLNGDHYIEKRPGQCVRCLEYCPVRSVCEFAPSEQIENYEGDSE